MDVVVKLGDCLWRPLTSSEDDTRFVLGLRNAPEALDAFYSSTISQEAHLRFLRRPQAQHEINWIVEKKGVRAGQCGIFNIDVRNRRAEGGRIVLAQPQIYVPSVFVMWYVGFEHLQLNRIYGEILGVNEVMLKAVERTGGVREGVLREHFVKNGRTVDVWLFGVLASEWAASIKPRLIAQFGEPQLVKHVDVYADDAL